MQLKTSHKTPPKFSKIKISRGDQNVYTQENVIGQHQRTHNGPNIDSFLSNEMKTVIDMLERNKIQIQSTNNHRKKILSNTTTNNPTTTNRYINNTDSIREKQLILEGKDLERYLIP